MKIVFWAAVAMVGYAYIGYPALLAFLARFAARKHVVSPALMPTATMVVAAYNEEAVILQKVHNFLELDYPQERIELLVGTDGCTDATDRLLETVEAENVRHIRFRQRRGKAAVLNDLVKMARGEVLVFSDANTMYRPEAVRKLVRHFADPRIGGVCGNLQLLVPERETGSLGEAAYWSFENFLKRLEGKIRTVVGANGAIYALRKKLFEPLPTDRVIMDDFLIPLRAVAKGYDVIYDGEATAYETVAPNVRGEFRRKVRIGAANFNALREIAGLLNPRRGFVAFALWSHKILRWFIPFALVGAFVANAFLLDEPFYRVAFFVQLGFYGLALLGYVADSLWGRVPKVLLLPLAFVSANLGLLVGFFRFLVGSEKPAWTRVERSPVR